MRQSLFVPCLAFLLSMSHPVIAAAEFVEGVGIGQVIQAVQPGTANSCDSSAACEVTTSGHLTLKINSDNASATSKANFSMVQTIDFSSPTPNGLFGNCYPVGGTMVVTVGNGKLGLGFQGTPARTRKAGGSLLERMALMTPRAGFYQMRSGRVALTSQTLVASRR